MASKMRSLFHDPDYYVKTFHSYYADIYNKFDVHASWADRVFGEKIVPQIRVTLGEKEEFRVLGIGSGSGETDVIMLTKLLQRFPLINNRVVEPAEGHIAMYKALVQSKAHELHGVNCDWRQQTIDQYEKAGDLTKFHFVHAVQSLYYVEDPDRSLMYLYNLVEPGGVLLVTLSSSEKSQTHRFRVGLPSLQDDLFKHIATANIRDSLDRRGIPYAEYAQPSRIDVTKCFDPSSEEGAQALDVLTHIIKFKETASAELQAEVMQRLAEFSDKRGNKVVMINDWDAVVVFKPME
ncbi:histamine N-methyltransferase-like [Patiria miniata]|uniref:Histamine N-methyltransferase n=1 Tax=Patiria miniata TaxID=46514 RepID=A0A914BNS2_PATMI|nr:histamine N-methyltransferase-like [Patiria miniata]